MNNNNNNNSDENILIGNIKSSNNEWKDHGSSIEVEQMHTKNSRKLLRFSIIRNKNELNKMITFNDAEPLDKVAEYHHQIVPNYDLTRKTLDKSCQISVKKCDNSAQTRWYRPKNQIIQSKSLSYSDEENLQHLNSLELIKFLNNVEESMIEAIKENIVIDLFKDEFAIFDDEETATGSKNENNLKTFVEFTHMTFSKGRIISDVQWHPTRAGVIAFSCTEKLSFDEWVEVSGEVVSSTILIWNFKDVLQPEYVLEAPGNVTCFSINSKEPNLIVAGLTSGQVVLWDLNDYLNNNLNNKKQNNNDIINSKTNDENINHFQNNKLIDNDNNNNNKNKNNSMESNANNGMPIIKPKFISYVDRSHSRAVSDIHWLPIGYEMKKNGEVIEVEHKFNNMFLTAATDGKLAFWDINDDTLIKNDDTRVDTSKWSPKTVLLMNHPTHFNQLLNVVKLEFADNTNFVCITEDGEVAFGDWGAKVVMEEDRPVRRVITHVSRSHFHACSSIVRSPLDKKLFMTSGDWTFSIWNIEDISEPVFISPPAQEYITSVTWSPTRPAVIFAGRSDGTVDVWDLLDQCHKDSLNYSTSEVKITAMKFWQSKHSLQQFLAAGDGEGSLYILEIPRSFRRPISKEASSLKNFFEREKLRLTKQREGIEKARLVLNQKRMAESRPNSAMVTTSNDDNDDNIDIVSEKSPKSMILEDVEESIDIEEEKEFNKLLEKYEQMLLS